MGRKLTVEELEQRIAPTVLGPGGSLSWTDANGDVVEASYDGPAGSSVELLDAGAGNIGAGDDVATVEFTDSDFTSTLTLLVTGGAGPTDIPVGSIFTTGSEDVGVISVGVSDAGFWSSWNADGTVDSVSIGGNLGALMLGGDLLSTQPVSAAGDIGAIFVLGDLELDATDTANISADDISFIFAHGDVTLQGGGTLTPQGTPVTITDDSGGTLAINVSGGTGEVLAIPVASGGYVVSEILAWGSGSPVSISIVASGAGGDVAYISGGMADTLSSLVITGAADTDIGTIGIGSGIGSIINMTAGGDIFDVFTFLDIGTIRTMPDGHVGWVWTGPNNSLPLFVPTVLGEGVIEASNLGSIYTGSLTFAQVNIDGNIGNIVAQPGGMVASDIYASGALAHMQVSGILDSEIYVEGQIGAILVGGDGILYSDIVSETGITIISVPIGAINYSYISTLVDGGGIVAHSGGAINSLVVASMHDTYIESFDGFGVVRIIGLLNDSYIHSWRYDPFLGYSVGGNASLISIGGMATDSGVEILGSVGTFMVGDLGMADESWFWAGGDVRFVYVHGPVTDESGVGGDADFGTIVIANSLTNYSWIEIEGDVRGIFVLGDLNDSYIEVDGNAGSIIVTGDVFNDSGEIDVGGNAGTIIVGSLVVGDGIEVGGNVNVLMVRSGSESSDIYIDGDVRYMYIGGDFVGTDIDVYGAVGILYSTGSFQDGSDIYIDGDAGSIVLAGWLTDDSSLNVNGSVNFISLRGYAAGAELWVGGSAGSIIIGSWIEAYDLVVDGNLGLLYVTSTMDGDSSYLEVGGTLRTMVVNGGVTEFYIDVYGDIGSIIVRGAISELDINVYGWAWPSSGNLESLTFANAEYLYIWTAGDIGTITAIGAVDGIDIEANGAIGTIFVGGTLENSDIEADVSIDSIQVRGIIVDSFINVEDYNFAGEPIGRGINSLSASEIVSSDIEVQGSINSLRVRGNLIDTYVSTLAYDNFGAGSLFPGGGINWLQARGLVESVVESYSTVSVIALGAGGLDYYSYVGVLDGSLTLLTSPGLIFGEIYVAGNVGSILTAGKAAVPDTPPIDFLFTDRTGALTGGTLEAGGIITGLIS